MMHSFIKWIALALLSGLAANAAAHKYFFGLTDMSVNPHTQQLEVIHQFTAHDIENTIAETQQIAFSPEHPQYELLIQQYIEKHFTLTKHSTSIPLTWVGMEYERGKIIAYQEANFKENLIGTKIANSLLFDIYSSQVNTVNYQDKTIKGSLTFTAQTKIVKIGATK